VRNSGQDTSYGTIAIECEAFLAGSLAEYWDDKGMEIPVWAYMNLLAHGTVRQIGECLVGPNPRRQADRSWRVARSYLAFEVLDLTDLEFTLAELQSSVLIPLELQMAACPDVAGWTPRQWVHLVEAALRSTLGASEQ
jgi:hypothetical protein